MVDIQKIVTTNFEVVKASQGPIGSYTNVLYLYYGSETAEEAKTVYRSCGGNDNKINAEKVEQISETSIADLIKSKKQEVSGTSENFIFVCFSSSFNNISDKICEELQKFTAPYKVIPCFTMDKATFVSEYAKKLENCTAAVKIVDSLTYSADLCLSIPAYYSQIQLDYTDSLRDYCYTNEESIQNSAVADSATNYNVLIGQANFVDKVGKSVVNFGGNLTNGVSITAQFGSIAVENDIIQAILKGMLNKQYLTSEGLNNIVSLINKSLIRYTHNGFLEQHSVYTGEDYFDDYTTPPTILIKKGVSLPEGYYVARIPMSKLKPTDRMAKKFTPIRIFMQTMSGARVVEINGTIIE